jgi:hypothetical protein
VASWYHRTRPPCPVSSESTGEEVKEGVNQLERFGKHCLMRRKNRKPLKASKKYNSYLHYVSIISCYFVIRKKPKKASTTAT